MESKKFKITAYVNTYKDEVNDVGKLHFENSEYPGAGVCIKKEYKFMEESKEKGVFIEELTEYEIISVMK